MNTSQFYKSGKTLNTSSPVNRKYDSCVICDDKRKGKLRFAITACGCRFHESCIVDFLHHQKSNNIFNRSCFSGCSVAVPLHKENTKSDVASNEFDIDQMNDSIMKSQCFYEAPALSACRTGNIELLQYEYNKCKNIIYDCFRSAIDDKLYSLISMATKEGQLEIVKFLTTNKNSRLNFPNGTDSVLHVAVQNGHLEIVKYLILSGSFVTPTNSDNKTALEIAIDNNYQDIIEELTKKTHNASKVVFGTCDSSDFECLLNAVTSSDIKKASSLMSPGNIERANKEYLLCLSVENNHLEMVKLLHSHGAFINSRSRFGCTALYIAIGKMNHEIVEYLCANGADVNLQSFSESPISYAIRNNDEHIVSLLFSIGGLKYSAVGDAQLRHVIMKRYLSMLKLLIAHQGNKQDDMFALLCCAFDYRIYWGNDAVIWLINNCDYTIFSDNKKKVLLREAIRTDDYVSSTMLICIASKDTFFEDPLTQTIFALFNENKNRLNILFLLDSGIWPAFNRLSDDVKGNIIYDFVSEKDFDSIEYLNAIALSFNYDDSFNAFNVCFLMAIRKNDLNMIDVLIARGVDVNNIDDSSGMTYLSYAIKHNCWYSFRYLIEKNADINLMDRDTRRTPLHNAIDINTDMILYLIREGASIDDDMDKDGHTPLSYATVIGNTSIIELLNGSSEIYKSNKEDIINSIITVKEICEENQAKFGNKEKEFDININKFKDAIDLIEYLDNTKITKEVRLENNSWFCVSYKNKLLFTITGKHSCENFASESSEDVSSTIEISNLFNELFYEPGAPGYIKAKDEFESMCYWRV